MISRSLPMRRICEQLEQASRARLVLIEGEAGTGKQSLAMHIRGLTPGSGNLAAEEAGILFGAEGIHAGGPPSADPLASALEQSAQGLLLLRGIDQLTAAEQPQLLRFIRSFESATALGALNSRPAPLQVICTTRQPLRAKVLTGEFLPELYYRLSAVCLSLPPLRDRKEDMPGLARIFIEACARERRAPLQGLGSGALSVLLHHSWPGNVREFESVIRAACFSVEGQWLRPIDLVILPLAAGQSSAGERALGQNLNLDGVLRRHVQRVLKVCDGNKARAAAQLGISRSTLYRMLESETDTQLPISTPTNSGEKEPAVNSELMSVESRHPTVMGT